MTSARLIFPFLLSGALLYWLTQLGHSPVVCPFRLVESTKQADSLPSTIVPHFVFLNHLLVFPHYWQSFKRNLPLLNDWVMWLGSPMCLVDYPRYLRGDCLCIWSYYTCIERKAMWPGFFSVLTRVGSASMSHLDIFTCFITYVDSIIQTKRLPPISLWSQWCMLRKGLLCGSLFSGVSTFSFGRGTLPMLDKVGDG